MHLIELFNVSGLNDKNKLLLEVFTDIYNRRKIGDNVLFKRLKNYHLNIKLTKELNSSKFIDSKLTNISGFYKLNVYKKSTKLPSPRTSKTPKRYK